MDSCKRCHMQVKVRSWPLISSFLCNSNLRLLLNDLNLNTRKPASPQWAIRQRQQQPLGARGKQGNLKSWRLAPGRGHASAWMDLLPQGPPQDPGLNLRTTRAPFPQSHGPARRLTPSLPPRPLRAAPAALSPPLRRGEGAAGSGAGRTAARAGDARRRREARGLVPGSVSRRPPPLPHARSGPGCGSSLLPPRRPPARGSGPLPAEGTGRQLPVGRGGPWRPVSMNLVARPTPHAASPAAAIFSPAHTHSHRPPRLRTGRAPRGAGRPGAPGARCARAADRWACAAGAGLGWTLSPRRWVR